jgi:glycosyltransferase involved in cell wall biosynthesis
MSELPKVVALLPAYNAERFIQRTLDSLAAQTWPNFEIVIADDCSTDGTLAIVEAFAATRDNVRVIARTKNLGWLDGCNALMEAGGGDYQFFAFHDDTVEPTYVEKLAGSLMADPGAILAYTDMHLTMADGKESTESFAALEAIDSALVRGLVMAEYPENWWVPNRGLFRSSAYRRIGGIKRSAAGEFSADWTWLLHMALLGRFVRVPEVLLNKYYQKTSLSISWAFSRAQRRALRAAGAREVWQSDRPVVERAALAAYIGLNIPQARRALRRLRR